MLELNEVLRHLGTVKETGTNKWMTNCTNPEHPDHNPSMQATFIPEKGRWFFKCFARDCSLNAILEGAGLTRTDVGIAGKNDGPSPGKLREGFDWFSLAPEAVHFYDDGRGNVLHKIERRVAVDSNGKREKRFTPYWRPNHATTVWTVCGPNPNEPDAPTQLYQLGKVREAVATGEPIFIVEGEKCADVLTRELNLCATTNPGGALGWDKHHTKELKGAAKVIIVPDYDSAGWKRLTAIGEALKKANIAVHWLDLGLEFSDSHGLDVADWIEEHEPTDFYQLMAAPTLREWNGPVERPMQVLETVSAADLLTMELPPTRWVIPGLLPAGLTLLCGKPKHGKSFFALGVSVAAAKGGLALGYAQADRCGVLYLDLEMTKQQTQSRLQDMLADERGRYSDPGELEFRWTWPRMHEFGAAYLDSWLDAHTSVGLVVVDVLKRFRGQQEGKGALYDLDYEAIEALKAVADRHNVAVLVLHHLRKMVSEEDPFDEISGSTGLTAAATSCMVLKPVTGKGEATLYMRGRDVPETTLTLKRSPDGGWNVVGLASENPVAATPQQQKVLDALKKADRPLLPRDIVAETGLDKQYVSVTLSRLHNQGKIRAQEDPKGWVLCSVTVSGVSPVSGVSGVSGVSEMRGNGGGATAPTPSFKGANRITNTLTGTNTTNTTNTTNSDRAFPVFDQVAVSSDESIRIQKGEV